MVKLYKDGDRMGVGTDCTDERDFISQFSELLSSLIEGGRYRGDWEFQLALWLPMTVDICCKLRGYKADLKETTWLLAGSGDGAPLVAEIDNRNNIVVPQP